MGGDQLPELPQSLIYSGFVLIYQRYEVLRVFSPRQRQRHGDPILGAEEQQQEEEGEVMEVELDIPEDRGRHPRCLCLNCPSPGRSSINEPGPILVHY